MNLPPVAHLPGLPHAACRRRILGSTLEVPELDAAAVQQVNAHLRDAARTLRNESVHRRVQRIASASQHLRRRGSARWREALARSTGLSHAGLDAAWEVTFAPLEAEALHAALHGESLDDDVLVAQSARVPRQILHVVAGNVMAPTMQMLVRGWLLGAAQWLRPSSREPLFAACVVAELEEIAPELAACTAVLWWPHASPTEAEVVGASDAVTVQGDDASVTAVRKRVEKLHPDAAFVGFGSRWSAALFSESALTAANARALAHDVALFDQQGCLSPTMVFVERSPHVEGWCAELAKAFGALESSLPRGPLAHEARAALRHWHETTRLKRVLGSVHGFWEGAIRWGVALTPDVESLDTPLDRHVLVVPFDAVEQLSAVLGKRLDRLQGLAVALDGWSADACARALSLLAPSRAAKVGTLQLAPPTWHQDHKPPLTSLFKPRLGL